MPGSLASVFGEADELEAALRESGCLNLLVTGKAAFRARLTRIALNRVRLAAGEEDQPRIACVAAPAQSVLVAFAVGTSLPPVWGAVELEPGGLVTVAPGERLHWRTEGPCRWALIEVAAPVLVDYIRALTGGCFAVPGGIALWRPAPPAGRQLRRLHRLAIRTAQSQWRALGEVEAAHGLEQQVIEALVECVAAGPSATETPAGRRRRCLLTRFDALIEAGRFRDLDAICAALGASEQQLRQVSKLHLGMGPSVYRQRRTMQQVHRALRSSDPHAATVSEIARRHGFRALGRFAGNYRGVYSELPSATLRREPLRAVPDLTLGRPRLMTFS